MIRFTADRQLLSSLDLTLLPTQRLAITGYGHSKPAKVEDFPIFQTLPSANDLRTLALIKRNTLSFTSALDHERNLYT
jgi:hypothetical protein